MHDFVYKIYNRTSTLYMNCLVIPIVDPIFIFNQLKFEVVSVVCCFLFSNSSYEVNGKDDVFGAGGV